MLSEAEERYVILLLEEDIVLPERLNPLPTVTSVPSAFSNLEELPVH
jgi:hypothetical protein